MFWRRKVNFHEDDHCQQQFLPTAALSYVQSELAKIAEHSKQHSSPDGVGWTDIYLRDDGHYELDAIRIEIDALALQIASHLPAFDRVYTGYSSYRERCKDVKAWGLSESCVVFVDWNAAGFVTHIWTSMFDEDSNAIRRMAKALVAVAECHQMIFVDWAWGVVVDRVEEESLVEFFQRKNQQFADRMKEHNRR